MRLLVRVQGALQKASRLHLVPKKVLVNPIRGAPYYSVRWVKPEDAGGDERQGAFDFDDEEALSPEEDYRRNGVRSAAFKAWFGDWENDPASASKVVDDDGEPEQQHNMQPITMYHGSQSRPFSAFDSDYQDPHALYGPGFYFTADRSVAESYVSKEAVRIEDRDQLRGWRWQSYVANKDEVIRAVTRWYYKGAPEPWPDEDTVRAALAKARVGNASYGEVFNALERGEPLDDSQQSRFYGVLKKVEIAAKEVPGVEQWRRDNPAPKPGRVYEVYLNIRNPLDMDARMDESQAREFLTQFSMEIERFLDRNRDTSEGEMARAAQRNVDLFWRLASRDRDQVSMDDIHRAFKSEFGFEDGRMMFTEIAKRMGYDGITHIGGGRMGGSHHHRVYIAFEPTQIKAADNAGTFDSSTPDIHKSEARMKLMVRLQKAGANRSHLVPKKTTVTRNGKNVQTTVWVKPGEDAPKQKGPRSSDPESSRGSAHGYGMHNIETGDSVSFKQNGKTVQGEVTATSKTGVTVKTPGGESTEVQWKDITRFQGGGEKQKPAVPSGGDQGGSKEFVPPEQFTAGEWKAGHDDPNVTADQILDEMSEIEPGVRSAIETTEKRLRQLEQTIANHRISGEGAAAVYDEERARRHEQILDEILTPELLENAKPADGEQPVFIMLGGRGGSGKSRFNGMVYDPEKCVVLDADEVKQKLDEYEGWNAFQVHEESSDILEKALHTARELGLNVVLDATMKTEKSAVRKVEAFKGKGYAFECHYMHLPRQEAAKRAVSRFMGKTQRYVPVDVVLSNTGNEQTFDSVKAMADAWSFRDNNVAFGSDPVLISESGKGRFAKMVKALMAGLTRALGVHYGRGGKRMRKSEENSKARKNADAYDFYDCGPETPDDKIDPRLKRYITKLQGKKGRSVKKSRGNRSHLVPKRVTVYRSGKPVQTTVWVKPEQGAAAAKKPDAGDQSEPKGIPDPDKWSRGTGVKLVARKEYGNGDVAVEMEYNKKTGKYTVIRHLQGVSNMGDVSVNPHLSRKQAERSYRAAVKKAGLSVDSE